MVKGYEAVAASTPETITFAHPVRRLKLSVAGSAVVYCLLNWDSSQVDVSATVFHVLAPSNGAIDIKLVLARGAPLIDNLRVFTTSAAVLGWVGE
jgi:hypothetical protein